VSGPALTPDLALDYLGELSTDIRAVLVLDSQGNVAAATGDDPDRAERMRGLTTELLDASSEASEGGDQVEVVTTEGSVFAVRGDAWTVSVVAGRAPLASLMFYDLRNVVRDLG
jgi:predicted regulator of Ras-like GTPase activity (Roadblock/LC7/MglB family)